MEFDDARGAFGVEQKIADVIGVGLGGRERIETR